MNEKSQLYEWPFLEAYVQERMQGKVVESYERIIQADDFLQTVVEGMEQSLLEQGQLVLQKRMGEKKRKVWRKLETAAPLLLAGSSSAPLPIWGIPPLPFLQNIRTLWDELRYSQFRYILGFNFSCVILILGFCFWINMVQEEEFPLLSQIEFPGGFKP